MWKQRLAYWRYQLEPKLVLSDRRHLSAAIAWLLYAHEQTGQQGVPAFYDLKEKRWAQAYPETTGYIISTLLAYSQLTKQTKINTMAQIMGDWECVIQLVSGGCRAGGVENTYPRIFNTGQVILGWAALFHHTQNKKFKAALVRAADFLVENQELDGTWTKYELDGPKAYHAEVDWPLLEAWKITNDPRHKTAALKNLDWVMTQQIESGWFKKNSLSKPESPWTHLIAYTVRGLLESGILLNSKDLIEKAKKAADAWLAAYERDGFIPGTYSPDWTSSDTYTCLTGNAQIAVVWLRLFALTQDERYARAAKKVINSLKPLQHITSKNANLRGGLAGSQPVSGSYSRFKILNWATKYLADAMMLAVNPDLRMRG